MLLPSMKQKRWFRHYLNVLIFETIRYHVKYLGCLWAFDMFADKNEILTVAELELVAMDETFLLFHCAGKEVTDNSSY